MNALKLFEVQAAITCGEYSCLSGCCASGQLLHIWRLMQGLGETDIPLVEKMLCGCAVGKDRQVDPTPHNDSKANCTDSLIATLCASRGTAETLRSILAGVAVTIPVTAPITGPLAAFLTDLIHGCDAAEGRSSWFDTIIDKVCQFDAWSAGLMRQHLPDALASALLAIRNYMNPIGLAVQACCTQVNVGSAWPTIVEPPGGWVPAQPSGPTILTSTSSTGTSTEPSRTATPTQAPILVPMLSSSGPVQYSYK